MNKLLKNKLFVISLTVIVLIFGGLIIAWQSALYTLNHMSFKNVTPTQLAAAMRKDEFWSDYRFDTLVFSGTVNGVNSKDGVASVNIKTADTYSLTCEVKAAQDNFTPGKTYAFEAETYQAERQPQGVLLRNCINP